MENLLLIAYMIFGTCMGYKMLSGRSEWLDRKTPLNMIAKFVLCYLLGCTFGSIYLIILLLQIFRLFF